MQKKVHGRGQKEWSVGLAEIREFFFSMFPAHFWHSDVIIDKQSYLEPHCPWIGQENNVLHCADLKTQLSVSVKCLNSFFSQLETNDTSSTVWQSYQSFDSRPVIENRWEIPVLKRASFNQPVEGNGRDPTIKHSIWTSDWLLVLFDWHLATCFFLVLWLVT